MNHTSTPTNTKQRPLALARGLIWLIDTFHPPLTGPPTNCTAPLYLTSHQKERNKMSEQRKAVIKNADMSEDMQQDAVDCASQALSKYNIEKVREWGKILRYSVLGVWAIKSSRKALWPKSWKEIGINNAFQFNSIKPPVCVFCVPLNKQDIAAYIKKEFDKKYNPTWWVDFIETETSWDNTPFFPSQTQFYVGATGMWLSEETLEVM